MKLSFKQPGVISESRPKDYITKETILNHVSQEEMFERYSGEPISNEMFCSKLRIDKSPGCRLHYSRANILYHVDYSKGEYLDVFSYVSSMFNIGFVDTLKHIGHDYGLINNYSIERLPVVPESAEYVKKASKERSKIDFEKRDWSVTDANYWGKYKISSEVLELFNVVPVKNAWINDSIWYTNNISDPCYAYGFRNNQEIKLYKPIGLKSTKWRNNSDSVQGFEQLKFKSNYVVITKSLKDVMVLYMMGVEAVAVQSEGQVISKGTMDILKEKYKYIYVIFDNDRSGMRGMVKHVQEYDFVQCMMFPTDLGKDASDIIEVFSDEIVNKIKNKIKEGSSFFGIIKTLRDVKRQ